MTGWLKARGLRLNGALPLGSRVGLVLAALVVFFVACAEPPPPVGVVEGKGAPTLTSVSLSSISPAGSEVLTIKGTGFKPDMVVWISDNTVKDVKVNDEGTELTFVTPRTRAGASLDLGVGSTKGGETSARAVLEGGYQTGGLGAGAVAALGLALAILALLGTPLFVIIAGVTCLGLFLEAQLNPGFGFLFGAPDPNATLGYGVGTGNNLFTSWLVIMGESPLFIAIPLFTFAGTLMSESKAPTRLINLCRALIGWLPGGLALVTLVTCCFFTAFTGASGVTIVALGGLLFPILLREKYPERFSLGLLTTGGSLGLLFPPSLPVIVYGLVAGVDVARLFQAALIPGIILVLFLAITSFGVAVRSDVPRHRFTFEELKTSLRGVVWELPLPFLVVGGIYSGVITAAEASAVTVAYVILTTVVIYRDVAIKDLPGVVKRTAVLVGAILMIMGTALGFTDWLTLERIPQKILEAMQSKIGGRLTFLLALNIFLLIVGCMMDIFSAILVVVPLIAPVAREFGVDPYHLGVIFLVNLEIGYSTPPVGINLFIASLRFRRPVFALYRASVLFIGVLMIALLLITYVPATSLGMFGGLPSAELRAPIGVEFERNGVEVKRVLPGSWAETIGLKRGDKLVSFAGVKLRKRNLREQIDGASGTQTLVVERGGAPVELSADCDARLVGESLKVTQRAGGLLHVEVQLGGVTLVEAKAELKEAIAALRSREEELELNFDDLDLVAKEARERLNTAKDAAASAAAKKELAAATEKMAPLVDLAKAYDEARRRVDDLATMARTVKWRSRLDGTESIGADFPLDELKPGTHVISATATDKRRHVTQVTVEVTIVAGEESSEKKRTPKVKKTGDDDDWGDDDDDDWGDDDDDDDDAKKDDDDGDWGDDDDDDWGDDDDDDDEKKTGD